MKTWVRRSLNAGALTAGALLAGGAAAQASPMVSTDNIGALTGNQLDVPVQVPVNVCGNAIAVAGIAGAGCEGGASALNPEWRFAHYRGGPDMVSSGNIGLLTGNQLDVPVQVPVNVCGNAVGVLGVAAAGCDGGADATIGRPDKPHHKPDHDKKQHGKKDYGKKDYGKKHSDKQHYDGPKAYETDQDPAGDAYEAYELTEPESYRAPERHAGNPDMVSSGNIGLLTGNQLSLPVQLPVNVCGNAIAVLGSAVAGCEGGASAQLK